MDAQDMDLLPLLKEYFGHDTFRPLQETIIRDVLAEKDVLAVLPTGGGKSLCFQLPALAMPGLTVVISPLIALMKDQVDALQSAGVAATYLNSSLDAAQARSRLHGLHTHQYRLLYISPERLALPGFIDDLKDWGVRLLAVDEAHCISEWGHDFRPEYGQMAAVRPHFPGVPVLALTATATQRVREDIVRQLALRDPGVYVASFNRPNLTYAVQPRTDGYDQVLRFIRNRSGESGVVYCQTRKTADRLAERLKADGVRSTSYHAGLTAEERSANQERFLKDEVQVVCATIAFGMGINKPNVRFVIHHDLPKNIEGYYQETGRAGRDGLPSECLLLYNPGDAARQHRFIDEKPDPEERKMARAQLARMVGYAESLQCRRIHLLGYFGETYPPARSATPTGTYPEDETSPSGIHPSGCGACDICLQTRQTWDATLPALKLLSCVYRIRERSGFPTGLQHVVAVLMGADTGKIRQFGHDQLSTYGIGKDHKREEWLHMGRELIRTGLLRQDPDRFNIVELTPAGRAALSTKTPIHLVQAPTPPIVSVPRQTGGIDCDERLFQKLRERRRQLATDRGVPPYIIVSDVSLRWMARLYPQTREDFLDISGIGQAKMREFGDIFMADIMEHLALNSRQSFRDDSTSSGRPSRSNPMYSR
jgi:ATP-dependent DNA helicase RecQ